MPAFRYDRLGVELDAPQGQVHMLKPHDHSVPGSGRDFQLAPHGSGLDRQGVVAGDPQRRRQAVEHADAGVLDEGRLSVPKLRGVRNRRPESLAESLVPQAHAEHRRVRIGAFGDGGHGRPRLGGRSRSR